MAEEISESVDTPSESTELNDIDAIADAFMEGEDADTDGAEEGAAEEAGAEDAGDAPVEGEGEELPEVPMPEGWEADVWGAMTPQARNAVDAAVKSHAAQIAAERQAQARIREEAEQYSMQANAHMQQALQTMKSVVEGEFYNLDWNALAQQDPARYVELQQAYRNRMNAVQGIQQKITAQVQQMQANKAALAQQQITAEKEAVLPEVQALIGAGFDQKEFVSNVANYMAKVGFPHEAINGIATGYELKTVVKAMLYDKIQEARATAAKKTAAAPKIQSPASGATDGSGDRASKARALLFKNPDSTDALAAYYETL